MDQAARAWLASLELPTRQAALQRDMLLEELTHTDRQRARVEDELKRLAATNKAVWRLARQNAE